MPANPSREAMKVTVQTASETCPGHVQVSEAIIQKIVKHALPTFQGAVLVHEESSSSAYSDRIFAISCGQPRHEYILKFIDPYFGVAKVDNEVGCLLLHQTFCPSVPVARVIAWSVQAGALNRPPKDGRIIVEQIPDLQLDSPGWILMTRLPGKPLDVTKLTPAQRRSVVDQLARITLQWRRGIPWSAWAGDIRFSRHPSEESTYLPSLKSSSLPEIHVWGLLSIGRGFAPPMGSMLTFWQSGLRCLVDELDTEDAYETIRHPLSAKIHDCIDNVLPRLSVLRRNQKHEFVFTHADLAPSNILVSEYYPSVITGVVGFGFSGFFPTWSQFFAYVTNDELLTEDGNENPDWPQDMYKSFVKLLAEQGVATSHGHEASREWKQLANLMKLELNIAPFSVGRRREPQGEILTRAKEAVDTALERLRSLSE